MGSLPPSYDSYISAINATSSVLGSHLSADDLMLTVTEEYECRSLKSKGKSKEENAAFHAGDSKKDRKGGQKRKGECHNCGKKGHWTRDCYAEGGGKEGEGPKQKEKKDKEGDKDSKGKGKKKEKETAAVAKDNDKDDRKEEEAWMAMVLEDEWALNEPNDPNNDSEDHILDLPHLFDDTDGTLDVPEEVIDADQEVIAVPENVIKLDLEMAYLAGMSDTRSAEVDLYDSGTSRHMSGFFHRFINYSKVEPIPIITADKRTFQAIGKGDMYVYLPNGDKPNSRILLKDVLYAPRMGTTLVSISRIVLRRLDRLLFSLEAFVESIQRIVRSLGRSGLETASTEYLPPDPMPVPTPPMSMKKSYRSTSCIDT